MALPALPNNKGMLDSIRWLMCQMKKLISCDMQIDQGKENSITNNNMQAMLKRHVITNAKINK